MPDGRRTLKIRGETSHQRSLAPDLRHDTCQTDPDLAQIHAVWSSLPTAVRASIMMLVQAAAN
jgi:hypothetical protein